MIQGMYVSARGAMVQSLRHDVIANNLANVQTMGFRRHLAILGAQATAPTPGNRPGTGMPGLPTVVATVPETGQGSLIQTGRQADFALDGEGYFAVSDGQRQYYTRAGHFDVNDDGQLVTADHRFHVQDVNGRPITVDPTVPFEVTEGGEVLQAGVPVGRIGVVNFRNPEVLRSIGGGLLAAAGGEQPTPTRVANVCQGYLEHSTVEAVRELVAMLEAYRAYEANCNLIANQDATLGRLINEAGRGV